VAASVSEWFLRRSDCSLTQFICKRFEQNVLVSARNGFNTSDHQIIFQMRTLILFIIALGSTSLLAENWPGWRGPRGDGTSLERSLPREWSADSNLLWKTELNGDGHSSPIVWENRVFTEIADLENESRELLCLDARSGQVRWRKPVLKSPLERKHRLNSYASSTPATDGKSVYVAFLDKSDMVVASFDFNGKRQWTVRPGIFSSRHGFCSSPVIWEDKLIINGDHDGESYIVALNRKTGKTIWKTPRPNKTRSYCVPVIYHLSGRNQMILSGDKSVASYDPDTGKAHWYYAGPTEQFVASLVYNPKADLLFMTGGFPEHHVMGIRHDGRGDINDHQVAWHHERASYTSYVPSPISEGDYFIVVSDPGYACCFKAADGTLQWQEKLGSHHASLVSADGLVYLLSDVGETRVVKPGPKYRLGAENKLGERGEKFFASPAISNGRIFLRSSSAIYCIGNPKLSSR
jgi:outer membrane protein assembly factor BamB